MQVSDRASSLVKGEKIHNLLIATVTATFFAASDCVPSAPKSDLILPISAQPSSSSDDDAPSVPPAISVSDPTATLLVRPYCF